MYKTLMLFLAMLTSAAWLQAQTYPQSSPTESPGNKTVQGCLQASGGGYTLTADSGRVHKLNGNTAELKDHVGHEVQINGTSSGSSAASPFSATGAATSQQETLDVKSMKHVATTCKSPTK
jgi:hypothetical protein